MGMKPRKRPLTNNVIVVDAYNIDTGTNITKLAIVQTEAGRQRAEQMGHIAYVMDRDDLNHISDEWDSAVDHLAAELEDAE